MSSFLALCAVRESTRKEKPGWGYLVTNGTMAHSKALRIRYKITRKNDGQHEPDQEDVDAERIAV